VQQTVPRIVVCEDKDSVSYSVSGDINAAFVWPHAVDAGDRAIRINLRSVQYINSVGVKNWIRTFPFAGKRVELFEVNVHVMDAFNMTPAMQLGCQIQSFYVPVYCKRCEETFELIETKSIDFSSEAKIRLKPCSCGLLPEIDTDLNMYLTCIRRGLRPSR
jgi:hypothetical protein